MLIVYVLFFIVYLSSLWPVSDRKPLLYLYLYYIISVSINFSFLCDHYGYWHLRGLMRGYGIPPR